MVKMFIVSGGFGHCSPSSARIDWNHRVSNMNVSHLVSRAGSENNVVQAIADGGFCLLGHVLHISDVRLPHRALFSVSFSKWK